MSPGMDEYMLGVWAAGGQHGEGELFWGRGLAAKWGPFRCRAIQGQDKLVALSLLMALL